MVIQNNKLEKKHADSEASLLTESQYSDLASQELNGTKQPVT